MRVRVCFRTKKGSPGPLWALGMRGVAGEPRTRERRRKGMGAKSRPRAAQRVAAATPQGGGRKGGGGEGTRLVMSSRCTFNELMTNSGLNWTTCQHGAPTGRVVTER